MAAIALHCCLCYNSVIILHHGQNPVFRPTVHPPPQGNHREARLSGFMGCDFVQVIKLNAVPEHQ